MAEWGATVRCIATNQAKGEVLRRMESDSDVFIISTRQLPEIEAEEWLLRSDRFPSSWEGKQITICWFSDDEPAQYTLVPDWSIPIRHP